MGPGRSGISNIITAFNWRIYLRVPGIFDYVFSGISNRRHCAAGTGVVVNGGLLEVLKDTNVQAAVAIFSMFAAGVVGQIIDRNYRRSTLAKQPVPANGKFTGYIADDVQNLKERVADLEEWREQVKATLTVVPETKPPARTRAERVALARKWQKEGMSIDAIAKRLSLKEGTIKGYLRAS